MAPCNCGSRKNGSSKPWHHLTSTGQVIKTYTAEYDARLAAAKEPGTRVRQAS